MNIISEHDLLVGDGQMLEVWRVGRDGDFCVSYANCEIKEGIMLVGRFGRGKSFSEAINDYYKQIKGKTLVFNASSARFEVRMI